MKIALAQINQIIGDFEGNFRRIETALVRAEDQGADLVVFPETAASGPFPGDFLGYDGFVRDNLELLDRLTARTTRTGILIGYVRPCPHSAKLENAAALIAEGEILSTHVKTRLSVHGAFDEFRYFEPGDAIKPVEFCGVNLAVTLCEDICRPDFPGNRRGADPTDPTADAVARGAEIIVNLAASPFTFDTRVERRRALRECAARHQRPLVFVNHVGGHDEWVFDGQSLALDAEGNLIACADSFVEDFLIVDVEAKTDPIVEEEETESESVVRALMLGTRDAVQKQGQGAVLVELNESVNASVTAAVAAAALGANRVRAVRFPGTDSSGEIAVNPDELAACIGISPMVTDAGLMRRLFEAMSALDDENGAAFDILENRQTAVKQMILRSVADAEGLMLFGSDDKTDLYLYGPSLPAADFCMLSDLPKSLVLRTARHLGAMGIPAFRGLPIDVSTASVRLSSAGGVSPVSLETVDLILDHCLVQRFDTDTVIALGFDAALTEQIVQSVHQTEARRRRAPPGLNITTRGFGYYPCLPISHGWKSVGR